MGLRELSEEDYKLWKKYEEYIRDEEVESIRHSEFNALANKLENEGAFKHLKANGGSYNYNVNNYQCTKSPLGVHVYVWHENWEECCGFCGEPEDCK